MEVHDVAQEAVAKTIPEKKKCKKTKWLSEEALQTAEKRSKAKGEGERGRHTLLSMSSEELWTQSSEEQGEMRRTS